MSSENESSNGLRDYEMYDGPDREHNLGVIRDVNAAISPLVIQSVEKHNLGGFLTRHHPKQLDYGQLVHRGWLKDGSPFNIYERGFILVRRKKGDEPQEVGEHFTRQNVLNSGSYFCEAELTPYQIKVLTERIRHNDYASYDFTQRDLQYLKLIRE